MCNEVLSLFFCVVFWEVVEDLSKQSGIRLYVTAKEYDYLEVNNVCDYFV